MKLFKEFEIVKIPEEDIILVTDNQYIYYYYYLEYRHWHKYQNAGNDHITTENYDDISPNELLDMTGGIFPKSETDFMRLCNPKELAISDMIRLLEEDYPEYMSEWSVYRSVHHLLLDSNIVFKSYLALRNLFDTDLVNKPDTEDILEKIRDMYFKFIGRELFKKEIGIVDGHDSSSYFWIMPVRVIDYTDTNDWDCVAEMRSNEISIEMNDVDQYLTPFLFPYFDDNLEANKKRVDSCWKEDDGSEHYTYYEGFEWYLTHNFYTYDAVRNILNDIKDTITALRTGTETKYTKELRKQRGFNAATLLYAEGLTQEQINQYNANRPKEDDTEAKLIIDFYERFIYRMEYMLKVGEEKGYDLISFMGP